MPSIGIQILPQGPFIQVLIGVSAPCAESLQAQGQPVPTARQMRCLIDTGATTTHIDMGIINAIGLTATGSMLSTHGIVR